MFSNNDNISNYDPSYELKIGLHKLDTTDILKSQNIILSELNSMATDSLLSINKDYTLKYMVAKTIEKVNGKEYLIELNQQFGYTKEDIENSVNILKASKESIYFKNVSNISSISKSSDNSIAIRLENEDPYFLYKLNFPISRNDKKSDTSLYVLENKTDTSLVYKRNNTKSTLSAIKASAYSDADDMIEDFKNSKLDMFFASSDSIMKNIGKYDYSVKKYRDGETVFLFGNSKSAYFSKKEIRQAILYALNREEIVKNVNSGFGEIIDIPYIYSNIRYKHDIYGANNALLSNGWQKQGGVYTKKVLDKYVKLELSLCVNEADLVKVNIAEQIKGMLESVGIRVNISKLGVKDLEDRINNSNFDLVLADVWINENPDISFLDKYININEEINSKILEVKNSGPDNIVQNVKQLQDALYSEVACIGIMAKNTNIVYQKYILGLEETNYLNVFSDIQNIGKVVK